jgi:hypothetical protein
MCLQLTSRRRHGGGAEQNPNDEKHSPSTHTPPSQGASVVHKTRTQVLFGHPKLAGQSAAVVHARAAQR